MNKYSIGIDVGGTIVKFGLVDLAGTIVEKITLDTKRASHSKEKLIAAFLSGIKELLQKQKLSSCNILGVGFGLPGLIDAQKGLVHLLPNIPGWKNVPLKEIIENQIQIPTFLDNDVNLITLGEWYFGAGKGYDDLVCLTLGTGVGSGLILNDQLYRGKGFAAGELGHMPLNEEGPDCGCGGFGCFECYVGNRYLQEKAAKIFKDKNIRLEDVFDLANQGDIRAIHFWEETALHLGNGLVGIVNLLNPSLIIIGGGVSRSFKFLHNTIKSVIKRRAMKIQAKMVKVVKAKLGDDAGILGAQTLIRSFKDFK